MRAAVMDAEALVFGSGHPAVAEQIAIIFLNSRGEELWAEHYMVLQPFTKEGLSAVTGVPLWDVERAVRGYHKVTGDSYIHPEGPAWDALKRHIKEEIFFFSAKVYAKGPELEVSLFDGDVQVEDLAAHGCPKYPPGIPHDPLEECRFFARWAPLHK